MPVAITDWVDRKPNPSVRYGPDDENNWSAFDRAGIETDNAIHDFPIDLKMLS